MEVYMKRFVFLLSICLVGILFVGSCSPQPAQINLPKPEDLKLKLISWGEFGDNVSDAAVERELNENFQDSFDNSRYHRYSEAELARYLPALEACIASENAGPYKRSGYELESSIQIEGNGLSIEDRFCLYYPNSGSPVMLGYHYDPGPVDVEVFDAEYKFSTAGADEKDIRALITSLIESNRLMSRRHWTILTKKEVEELTPYVVPFIKAKSSTGEDELWTASVKLNGDPRWIDIWVNLFSGNKKPYISGIWAIFD
jgi:hypothetical protein